MDGVVSPNSPVNRFNPTKWLTLPSRFTLVIEHILVIITLYSLSTACQLCESLVTYCATSCAAGGGRSVGQSARRFNTV
jgi:hypothetical protein